MQCPGCGAPMTGTALAGNYGTQVELDLCHACHGLWFDAQESLALTPGSVIQLFKSMHERQAETQNTVQREKLACPRCRAALVATTDRQRNTRFSYHRCGKGCGRFITFCQWLREKNLVRELDEKQLAALRAELKVLQCSNCGAPVDLQRRSTCEYCQVAIAVLDPAAVEQTLRQLQAAEVKRTSINPTVARSLDDQLSVTRVFRALESDRGFARHGLIEAGLSLLFALLTD